MHEAAKNKREADANRARLEAEIEMTESMVENDLNNERRKKLQEKQRVRRQVEDEITKLTSELFSKKVCASVRRVHDDHWVSSTSYRCFGNVRIPEKPKQSVRHGMSPRYEGDLPSFDPLLYALHKRISVALLL